MTGRQMAWGWALALGYAIGSLPVSWSMVRATAGIDLRRVGSGNVGATNALRHTRWPLGMLVALLDAAKGSAAIGLATVLGAEADARAMAGLGAMLGHMFPVWLRGRGGKGVATAAGIFAVLAPRATLVSVGVFTLVAATTRLVSLASLAATVTLVAMVTWVRAPGPVIALGLVAGMLVIARHAGNLVRLARGTEPRLAPSARASDKGGRV